MRLGFLLALENVDGDEFEGDIVFFQDRRDASSAGGEGVAVELGNHGDVWDIRTVDVGVEVVVEGR